MGLTLRDLHVGTIIDWVTEWEVDPDSKQPFKERGLRDPIRRGLIVKTTGHPSEQSVTKMWVSFGESMGEEIKVNGQKVKAVEVLPIECCVAFDHESKESKIAWRRIFGAPVTVGAEFSQKKHQSKHRRIKDELALTPKAKNAVVTDTNDLGVEDMDLPEAKA